MFVKAVCKVYEMRMDDLLVDVETFSLRRKETLLVLQGEFQQHNWKS